MKIKQVICPRCKVDHEVYFHSHHEFTDIRCDECSCIDLTIGQSARYVKDNKIYTIAEINNNLCGDGCCSGYRFKDQKNFVWKTDVEGIYE